MVRPWPTAGTGRIKMRSIHIIWLALLGFTGCMVDFYGGEPRLQVGNGSHRWNLQSVGLGDTAKPGWTRGFDPGVAYGGLTEVMDLPVAGDLKLFLRVRDASGLDSVVLWNLTLEVGDFRKLQMVDDSIGNLKIR